MMRVFPIRFANKICVSVVFSVGVPKVQLQTWPMALLILCDPVWFLRDGVSLG